MSRFYNDFDSTVRDRLRGNVNIVGFPELHRHFNEGLAASDEYTQLIFEDELNADFLRLPGYERRNAKAALERLLSGAEGKPGQSGLEGQRYKVSAVKLFVGAAKLYAGINFAPKLSNPGETQR